MFFPLGGLLGSATGTAASLGLLATLGATIYALRRKVPHPTEFWIIGVWYRWLGIHTHNKFDLIVDIHQALNVPSDAKLYVFIKCGRFRNQTSAEKSKDDNIIDGHPACNFFQRLPIHIRQKDDILLIQLYRKTPVSSEIIGTGSVNILLDLIGAGFPRKRILQLKNKNGQNAAKLRLSYFKVESVPLVFLGGDGIKSTLAQQAMIQSQLNDEMIDAEKILSLPIAQRMAFFARAIEGPLRRLRQTAAANPWQLQYFRATTSHKGIWLWCFWNSRSDMKSKKAPNGVIPILSITAVLKNDANNSRHQFFIRYKTKTASKDIYLERVDRDRDLWVEGLYEFIQMTRDEYMKNPTLSEAQRAVLNQEDELEKRRRELLAVPPPAAGVRTLGSPKKLRSSSTDSTPRMGMSEPPSASTGGSKNNSHKADENADHSGSIDGGDSDGSGRSSRVYDSMYKWINDPNEIDKEVDAALQTANQNDAVGIVLEEYEKDGEREPLL